MSDFLTFVQGVFVDKILSTANQWQQIGQISGSGNFANTSLNFTNISPTENDTISIAISNNATSPNNSDIIESNIPMPVGAVLSRENMIAEVGEYVYILATTANIACRFSGITQALQDLEGFDAGISTLSSEIEYLSGVIDSNNTNLQNEINARTITVSNDVSSLSASVYVRVNILQNEINSLTNTLNRDIASLSTTVGDDVNNLQNEINALTTTLDNDVNSLQGQINTLGGNVQNAINQLNSVNGKLFSNLQNQTGSRGFGGTYYNNSGAPMYVEVTGHLPYETQGFILVAYVDGEQVGLVSTDIGGGTNYYSGNYRTLAMMVPNGSSYQVNESNMALVSWFEWTI